MDIAVEVCDLTVLRGAGRRRQLVLQHLSCRMEQGRITGLLGPSGAGKSTLIRAIVGVQRIASGTVTVLGEPAGSASIRRRLGYLTQAPSIYPDLTVRENARYFAALVPAGPGTADSVIEEVGLGAAADQLVSTLSGGQRSRASLACALVGAPEVLVLDEPTVGQDPVLREELWNSLRVRAAAGATVIVTSHVMDEANRCDHLMLIRDGGLLADDTPDAVKRMAGTDDLDAAFLTLIRRQAQASA
ncbi:ABC-2 type transport system ATP-binding protein [Nakamurella panacisegetis]|uniref:ABC-2 type transport system ATP-binding protein n=1 Tax=Nakamurella panacisegetis TaxID=1090615 RepID=A0A1H0MNB6_9ACTN|nr:ABC transporter ATP-binding protein [Nakamurella panacisegetis]SDO81785.1 ABC-2 type transport system ATP-binding protein [Nakamurella panacisegetis]